MKKIMLGFLFYAVGISILSNSGIEFWYGFSAFVAIGVGAKLEKLGCQELK